MQSHQRGRAGRVHRDGGALEAEGVRHPARHHAGRAAGQGVPFEAFGQLCPRPVRGGRRAGEHTRRAAAYLCGVDPRVFEGLPGALQQQALLRVHPEGLTRRDTEEAGVEGARAGQETAFAHGGQPVRGLLRLRAVQPVGVPATVVGEAGDRVTAVEKQPPQVVRRVHLAGEPAAHADDRDRVVISGGEERVRALRYDDAQDLGQQESGERGGGGVVEDEGRGQPETRRGIQPVAQLDRCQGVDSQVLELLVTIDRLGTGVAEHRGRLDAYEIQQFLVALLRGEAGEALPEGGRARCDGCRSPAPAGGADQSAEHSRQCPRGGLRLECREIQAHRHQSCPWRDQRDVEQGESVLVRERHDAGTHHTVHVGAVEPSEHAVRGGPGAPRERGRRQPCAAALLGEAVEEGVGCRVVRLARSAEDAGHRGERDEHRQVEPCGQFVQVDRAVDLRPQHGVEALARHGRHHAVVEDTRGVYDAGQRAVLGHSCQDGRQLITVGDVAGGQHDVGTGPGQFGGERGGIGGRCAAAAGQDEAAHTVLGYEVTCHKSTERTGGAGHQDRTVPLDGFGHGQDDLAHMACLGQEAERLGRLPHIPGTDRERLQRSAVEECEHFGHQLADPLGTGLDQVEGLVGDPREGLGDHLRVADVGLAHLHEPAAARQQAQRRVHELPGEGVQDDVDAPAFGDVEELSFEVECARGGDVRVVDSE